MANYPPPPPTDDQQQYNALYSTSAGAQSLLSSMQQDQFPLNQPIYPKVDSDTPSQGHTSNELHNLAQELRNQTAQEEQRQASQPSQQCHPGPQNQQPSFSSLPQHVSPSPQHQHSQRQAQKANRLRKACDSCSIRKVKCDNAGPPCRACAALDIPCTFERPSKRRGPPNRVAEAVKRQRLEESSPHPSSLSSPSSPTHAAQALTALSGTVSSQFLTAESICPPETMDALINDFFTYIHPLCPFPHEPSFREAWKRREDLANKPFLALLASMIGALVASFPRKPRLHLKAQKKESLFPNHMSLVEKCQKVCSLARGPGYLENEHLSVYDAATSYYLALMGVYTFRWRLGRVYFGECLTILRTLGFHKSQDQTYTSLGQLPASVGSHGADHDGSRGQNLDNITIEMGRRVFWTMFVSVKSMEQLGAVFGELIIPPSTANDPYPPLPSEVDDFCIYPSHNEEQPPGVVSTISGFNANVKVFSSYTPLATMEMAWGIDAVVDWDRQKRVLYESLRRCKDSIKELPSQLTVEAPGGPFHHHGNGDTFPNLSNSNHTRDPAQSLMTATNRMEQVEQSPKERRSMQFEIQKANIYASSLSTRSYIVEKYWNLCEAYDRLRSRSESKTGSVSSMPSSPTAGVTAAGIDGMLPHAPTSQPDMIEEEIKNERENIVKDLLVVLSSISQVNMEPNADSFTMKIRSIASTLLDVPDKRKGRLALKSQGYLSAFLKILVKLERVNNPASNDADHPEDDDTELKAWADLREYQEKFAQQGGLLGMS
ncbi:hypothetical protein K431DRAFT_225232 [Polychaeton citri CBS 116435]|uniref:Zn(2)-C6 fungal-type domain-containing protein n=1 Tax=Polychaeton citri CBS 116435 TaxID=1314669 RepID=A0A9P4Q712_9PEZI|nr:hypothetical protein K431DRAFT_225232 [Polychaeton citri CBS 116435]